MSILIVFKILASLLGFLGGNQFSKEIIFESAESKTSNGKVVFNKIQLTQKGGIDTWKMKQSHYGLRSEKWDNIKIIVNTNKEPYQVSYHQIKDNKEIDYSANCLRCHSNGPRLIRPSVNNTFSLKEKMTLQYWNLTIKGYGSMETKINKLLKTRELKLLVPKQYKTIKHQRCIKCHYNGGPRAALTSFQQGSIIHLIKNKQMPPWPYKLSLKEKNDILSEIYPMN